MPYVRFARCVVDERDGSFCSNARVTMVRDEGVGECGCVVISVLVYVNGRHLVDMGGL